MSQLKSLLLLAALSACLTGCDRSDRAACEQYADAIETLECSGSTGDGASLVTFCAQDSEATDEDSDESVALWDCYRDAASCDIEERFTANQACDVAQDADLSDDIRYDD